MVQNISYISFGFISDQTELVLERYLDIFFSSLPVLSFPCLGETASILQVTPNRSL